MFKYMKQTSPKFVVTQRKLGKDAIQFGKRGWGSFHPPSEGKLWSEATPPSRPNNLAQRQGGSTLKKPLKWGLLFLMESPRAGLGQFFAGPYILRPGLDSTARPSTAMTLTLLLLLYGYILKCPYHNHLVVTGGYEGNFIPTYPLKNVLKIHPYIHTYLVHFIYI